MMTQKINFLVVLLGNKKKKKEEVKFSPITVVSYSHTHRILIQENGFIKVYLKCFLLNACSRQKGEIVNF